MWSEHKDCRKFIEDLWQEQVVGSSMFILTSKLKNLKAKLKVRNKEVFGNLDTYVDEAGANLNHIQNQIQTLGHSDQLANHVQLEDALKKQNSLWGEKAKLKWHIEGDRNSKFFHRLTKNKNKTKLISSLINENEIIIDPSLIND